MAINLYEHQKLAVEKLKTGSILCGGAGSGKSRTAIAYYFIKEGNGKIDKYSPMKKLKDLYIITTARKRDTLDWEKECIPFLLSTKKELCDSGVSVIIDSWNNIKKFINIKNAFFIFDEQRVVGSGAWVKSFLKICKNNNWILLSYTPGDTWLDYIPVFVANGFYKNRTEFLRRHVVYNNFTKYPKVDHYIETSRLIKLRNQILVKMNFIRHTISHNKNLIVDYDKELYYKALVKRWNVYENKPVKDISELCYLLRKIVNSDKSRCSAIKNLVEKHSKIIIFYNYNYELDLLLNMGKELGIETKQWNGHKHEMVPNSDKWIYLVQYTAGSEGWNCVETDTTVLYSQNYSYKVMAQSAGRTDRLNTKFKDLYYYHLQSTSTIDMAIKKSLKNKQKFNENNFVNI